MAKVLGKAGRYVEDQSVKRSGQYLLGLFFLAAVVSFLLGFYFGVARTFKHMLLAPAIFCTIILAFIIFFNRIVTKRLDAIERERISFRKGAVGEAIIARILEGLSDDYVVLNDLTTPFGNIDFVVIGPTGVFAIDAKNWRGIVDADGNGELLVNGKPTSKPAVKNLVRTIMSNREKIKTLCGHEPYIRGILVFTSAWVEANFGTVKNADCMTDERLEAYITDKRNAGRLNKEQIDSISRAFEMLAGMDRAFDASPAATHRTHDAFDKV